MWFEIGGLKIATEAVLGFEQVYEPMAGAARLRLMSGAAVQQVWWRKLRTVLSGDGWWPPGLDGLDYDATLTLLCAVPRTLQAASNVIALPAARRTDTGYTPQGYALVRGASPQVGGGDLVPTTLGLAGDVATLGTVAGAIGYHVAYWPALTVWADPPTVSGDVASATHRWTLTAEEA